jgi:hypothetical protein
MNVYAAVYGHVTISPIKLSGRSAAQQSISNARG